MEQYIKEISKSQASKKKDDEESDEDDDSDDDGSSKNEKDKDLKKKGSNDEKADKSSSNSKRFLLCINKADYLSDELISHWNKYFKEKGVEHIFISAKKE